MKIIQNITFNVFISLELKKMPVNQLKLCLETDLLDVRRALLSDIEVVKWQNTRITPRQCANEVGRAFVGVESLDILAIFHQHFATSGELTRNTI